MIPSNNFSVLPFYTDIEHQNARKWWINGKIYPLYCSVSEILPFQILRPSLKTWQSLGDAVFVEAIESGRYRIDDSGQVVSDDTGPSQSIQKYSLVSGTRMLRLSDFDSEGLNGNLCAFFNSSDVCIGVYRYEYALESHDVPIPEGTSYIYIVTDIDVNATFDEAVCYKRGGTTPQPILAVERFTKNGGDGAVFNPIKNAITIKQVGEYDVIIYSGGVTVPGANEGQFYLRIKDGENTWYSDVYTAVQDMSCFTKLEWWDVADFVMDEGVIVYTSPAFKNRLYLQTEIAKPDYQFEEETEERDGYSFAMKQISKKVYRFNFLASEYLLDVMRFIRMADRVEITSDGQKYSADSFLITPEWESEGDIASVTAEFATATIAKKIGLAYNQQ